MAAKSIVHTDLLDNAISVGNHVAFCRNNNLVLGAVIKVTPKLIRVISISSYGKKSYLIYPKQAILLQESDMIVYLLKHSGD
jgi:hypothetical protein